MPSFTPGQLLILIAYVLVVFLIGVWPTKVRGREAFLISSRQLSGAGSGFTIAASKIGGGLLVTYSTLFFAFGWGAAWLFVGNILGYGLFYWFAHSLVKEGTERRYYTMADYFASHFGKRVGITVGILSVVSLGGWILTNLIAGGKLLAVLSGWPLVFCVGAMVLLIASYLAVGGFHAVVRTDWLQYAALFIIFGLIVFIVISPGTPIVVVGSSPMPLFQIIGFFILGALFPFGSVELWQRVYATRSQRSLRTAIAIAACSFVVLAIFLSLVSSSVMALPGGAEFSNEVRLPMGVAEMLTPGLAALWFVAFASAIISSADTFIFTTAASLVQDVLVPVGAVNERGVVRGLRWSIILLAAVGFGVAVALPDVVSITFVFVGITLVLGAVAIACWRFSRVSSYGVVAACVVGTAMTIAHAVVVGPSAMTGLLAFFGSVATLFVVEVTRIGFRRAPKRSSKSALGDDRE